jgi:hypothetical protein
MYNTFYRTMIDDQDARKFIDTFVGPTVSLASMMRIFRNGAFSLSTRIGLGLFVPIPRARTLYLLQNFNFTLFKTTIFAELYLHQRIWRHIFENGCGLIGLSTYYAVFRYKKAYLDPRPEKKSEEKKKDEKTTPAPKGSSPTSKKPSYKRKDGQGDIEAQPYQYNYHSNLPGYVPIEETDDALYGYKEPVYGNEESEYSYNQPSYTVNGYNNAPTYNFAAPSYNAYPNEPPQVENKFLSSFKSILSTLNPGTTSGVELAPSNNYDSFNDHKTLTYEQEGSPSLYYSDISSSNNPLTFNSFINELPQAENKSQLSNFKSALAKIKEDGYLDSWAPLATSALSPKQI